MFDQNFPERHPNHISETSSYKKFQNAIPDTWVIREPTERDYGIDAVLELTQNHNQVSGKMASIQLKSTKEITFNKSGYYKHSGINKTTTNYWLNSNLPSFLFFTNQINTNIYYLSIQQYVREYFSEYDSHKTFAYRISPANIFTPDIFIKDFKECEKLIELEVNICNIETIYNDFSRCFKNHYGRDFHMLIDDHRIEDTLNKIYGQIKKLCALTNIDWNISSINNFINDNPIYSIGEMYEYHVTEILTLLDQKLLEVLIKIQYIVLRKHPDFWKKKDIYTVAFFEKFDGRSECQKYSDTLRKSRGLL